MPVRFPSEISNGGFIEHAVNRREIRGHMVLESIFTDVAQKSLHSRNFYYSRAPKRFQRIIRKLACAYVATNSSGAVVRGKARVTHRPGLNASHAGSEGIVLADGACDDLLIVHLAVPEER